MARISKQMTECNDEKRRQKLHEEKAETKKRLPLWVFAAGKIDTTTRVCFGREVAQMWRKQEAIHLNGLYMADFDDIDDPQKVWSMLAKKNQTERTEKESLTYAKELCEKYGIVFAHITPSGRGLRMVCKYHNLDWNIADHQQWLAKELGLKADEACKDSARASYACPRENILHIELETLLTYQADEYEARHGESYRQGNSQPTLGVGDGSNGNAVPAGGNAVQQGGAQENGNAADEAASDESISIEQNEQGQYTYDGIPYNEIAAEYLKRHLGGEPPVGGRNTTYHKLVSGCMRYLCDNNAEAILLVTPGFGLPQHERQQTVASALRGKKYEGMPAKVATILKGLRLRYPKPGTASGIGESEWDYARWARRFQPYLTGHWDKVVGVMPEEERVNAMLCAGAMFGTLASGVRLQNWYDGSTVPLTFMVYIIGQAASGKGTYELLNKLIMEPLRLADEKGRREEERYIEDQRRRASSTAAAKAQPMELKHYPVRYLPSNITMAQRNERLRWSMVQAGDEKRQVACYTFESELSSKVQYEKSSWAAAQDFDKKSFSCEEVGSETRSNLTANGTVPAFFNLIATGTLDALYKKITRQNCLDGLPTRLIMGVQPDGKYKMIEYRSRRRKVDDETWLRTVGSRLLELVSDINLEQEVRVPKKRQDEYGEKTSISKALYEWGVRTAEICGLGDFATGDYFRRRVPMIAARYAAVYAIINDLDHFQNTGSVKIDMKTIDYAVAMCDYLMESQMYYFGKMVTEASEMATGSTQVFKNTKVERALAALPNEFSSKEICNVLGHTNTRSTYMTLDRLVKSHRIVKLEKDKYKKITN